MTGSNLSMCRAIWLFAVKSQSEVFIRRMASTEVIHDCVQPVSVDHTPQPASELLAQ